MVDTSDEWIRTRTGISERHAASRREGVDVHHGGARCRAGAGGRQCDPLSLDLIIVATATPDYMFPATACLVQDALGARNAGAFDLSAGLFRLCLCAWHGRRRHRRRHVRHGAGDRLRDADAHRGLERSLHLRALWRRRRRGGAEGQRDAVRRAGDRAGRRRLGRRSADAAGQRLQGSGHAGARVPRSCPPSR